jgi:hypothetical protein
VYLNDSLIKNTHPADKPQRLMDGDGLYLLIQPTGARWWRLRYYVAGKERLMSLGTYPEVTLKQARERRHDIRSQVANGEDPSEKRKVAKRRLGMTFELVAREWWGKRKHLWMVR